MRPASEETGVIPAMVTGVYGTIHADAGDFDTGSPEAVVIDCEMITFHLPIETMPFSGSIGRSFTLHLGIVTVEVPLSPMKVRRGDSLTIVQPVMIEALSAET